MKTKAQTIKPNKPDTIWLGKPETKYITDRTGYIITTTKENCKIITDDLEVVNALTWQMEDSLRYLNVQYLNTKEGRLRHYTLYFPIEMSERITLYLKKQTNE